MVVEVVLIGFVVVVVVVVSLGGGEVWSWG